MINTDFRVAPIRLAAAAAVLLLAGACTPKKAPGSVLVTVESGGAAVPLASVDLLTNVDSGLARAAVLDTKPCDAEGQVYFDGLEAGRYGVRATGYAPLLRRDVYGDTLVVVPGRAQQNHLDVTLDATP